MVGSHVASSSPEQLEDSWTCQRCGWVYPNARPSAKHRRNHKKQCGKVKGFELQSEVHKGGSSDEVSSDDGSHENKDTLPAQSAQPQHDSIKAVEAGTMVHVVEPPSASQLRELVPPETNDTYIKKSEAPVHNISDSVEVKPEEPTYDSMRNLDLIDIVKPKSSAAEHLPKIGPVDETATTLGDAMELKVKDTPSDSMKIAASDIPEGYNHAGAVSGLQGVDVDVSDHKDPSLQRGFMHEDSAPRYAGSMTSFDEPSKTIEGGGRRSTAKNIDESQLLKSDQAEDTVKFTAIPAELSINRQGSSQEDDAWTCRHCGWVYPNPHPSAKHRRNHKKHCGKLKGFEVQRELHKGGSSDEVSSDDEEKKAGHRQHDIHVESPSVTQSKSSGSDLTLTRATVPPEGQSGDRSTGEESCGATSVSGDTASFNDIPTLMAFSSDSNVNPESVPLASVEDTRSISAKDEVISQRDGGPEETLVFKTGKAEEWPQVTELPTSSLDNPGVDVSEERPMVLLNDKSSDNSSSSATVESKSEAIAEGGPPALVNDTPEDTPATSANDKGLDQTDRAVKEVSTSSMDKVVERPPLTEMPVQSSSDSILNPESVPLASVEDEPCVRATDEVISQKDGGPQETFVLSTNKAEERPQVTELPTSSLDNPGVDVLGERPMVLLNDKPSDNSSTSATIESKSEAITEGGPPALVRDTPEDTLATSANNEGLDEADRAIKEVSTSRMDEVVERPPVTEMPTQSSDNPGVDVSEERPAYSTGELSSSDDRPILATIESIDAISERGAPESIRDTPEDTTGTSAKDEVLHQTDGRMKETSTSSMDNVRGTPEDTSATNAKDEVSGVDLSEEKPEAYTTGELPFNDNYSSSTTLGLTSDIIPERGPLPGQVGDSLVTRPEDTLATGARDEVLSQTDGGVEEASSSSMDKGERPQVTDMPTLSLDNPGVDILEERPIVDTTGELSSSDNKFAPTAIESKPDIIHEREPPTVVEDPLATSTNLSIANDSDLSSSPKEGDSKQLLLDENNYKDKPADVCGPQEVSEKPDNKHNEFFEADFGSSGRSLDGTNSLTNAESEFSQRSEFAASSHKLSDSLEIFEDAPDTLDVCSVGGSVEESESLDEPRQLGDGVHEESKPFSGASLDVGVAGAHPKLVGGATGESELKPNGMNAGEARPEEKAATIPVEMGELKAPSPEAWQEPGPSTSAKEGKKAIISEVMEDGKSSESHTALRSLMSMEGKDKVDQAGASPLVERDSQTSDGKQASTISKKPKSRVRSFWSHCVCCPAVQ